MIIFPPVSSEQLPAAETKVLDAGSCACARGRLLKSLERREIQFLSNVQAHGHFVDGWETQERCFHPRAIQCCSYFCLDLSHQNEISHDASTGIKQLVRKVYSRFSRPTAWKEATSFSIPFLAHISHQIPSRENEYNFCLAGISEGRGPYLVNGFKDLTKYLPIEHHEKLNTRNLYQAPISRVNMGFKRFGFPRSCVIKIQNIGISRAGITSRDWRKN